MKHIKYLVQAIVAMVLAMFLCYFADGTKMDLLLTYLLFLNYLDMQDRPNA